MIQISFGFLHRKEQAKRSTREEDKKEQGNRQRQSLLPFAFCLLPFDLPSLLFAFRMCLLPTAYCLLSSFPCFAQVPPPKPYAAINHDAVSYNGPGRDAGHDLVGAEIHVGLLLPLSGPRAAEGEALQRAAQMAVDEENTLAPAAGHHLRLVARDESGPWGQASTQVVHMVFDDQAVALITSAEGDSAHLAEQVGNKIGVPILTLSTDSTTTEINLPWIFRMGPTDAMQAHAFAHDIYQNRKLQRVVLLSQNDRDGRLGGEAFIKAAGEINAPAPGQVAVDPGKITEAMAAKGIAGAQAVVIWTDASTASELAARLREARPAVPVYLCRKAGEGDLSGENRAPCAACGPQDAGPWIAAAPENPQARAGFSQGYRRRFGTEPGLGAAEAYDAVRVLAASLRQSGPNRARLRDALASVSTFAGASGAISFDHAGNDLTSVTLTHLY
jgi:branched-chain amino acid transport system substrate-binding protein